MNIWKGENVKEVVDESLSSLGSMVKIVGQHRSFPNLLENYISKPSPWQRNKIQPMNCLNSLGHHMRRSSATVLLMLLI